MRALILFATVVGFLPGLARASDVYVNALHGSDSAGDGSPAAPFRTLTKGVAALTGAAPHALHIAPGLYDAALGEVFPIVVGTRVSLLGAGVHETILSGGGSGTLLKLGRSALVSDVTLRRASVGVESPPVGGESLCYARRCAITQCAVGVYAYDSLHDDHGIALVSCAISGGGVGVRAKTMWNDFNSVTVQVYGSTITGNAQAFDTVQELGGIELYLGLYDSIVRGNGDDSISGWLQYVPGTSGNVLAEPSLVGVNGNVNVDPLLVHAALADVHLSASSPAVDLPAPAAPWPPIAQWLPVSTWIWESSYAQVGDLDGGARVLDAKIDAGADERRLPGLYAWSDAALGEVFELRGVALPGDLLVLYLGSGLLAPPLGLVEILPPYVPLGAFPCAAPGHGGKSFGVPADPALSGLDLYVQAARVHGAGVDSTNALALRLLP